MTRKDWFERHFLPPFRKSYPKVHITFDVFTNKSRPCDTFDHRTKNSELRRKAGELFTAEQLAVVSVGTEAEEPLLREVIHCFMDFIETSGAVQPHRSTWTRKYSTLDFDRIKTAIPTFDAMDFKLWTNRPDPEDHEVVQRLKYLFRESYKVLEETNDPTDMQIWWAAVQATYTRKS